MGYASGFSRGPNGGVGAHGPFHSVPCHPTGNNSRDFPSSRGSAHCQKAGATPHSQARKLAKSCPEFVEGMAEIEFSVLAKSCLHGRNIDEYNLRKAVGAGVSDRNAIGATINWRLTAQDARRRLRRLYSCLPSWRNRRPRWWCPRERHRRWPEACV